VSQRTIDDAILAASSQERVPRRVERAAGHRPSALTIRVRNDRLRASRVWLQLQPRSDWLLEAIERRDTDSVGTATAKNCIRSILRWSLGCCVVPAGNRTNQGLTGASSSSATCNATDTVHEKSAGRFATNGVVRRRVVRSGVRVMRCTQVPANEAGVSHDAGVHRSNAERTAANARIECGGAAATIEDPRVRQQKPPVRGHRRRATSSPAA